MSSATPPPTPPPTVGPTRRLPLAGALRLGRPSDIWFKPALSVVASVAPPSLLLATLGRLDLAMYTMAGSLCALYAHNRPYAARAQVLAGVVLGMLGGLAAALVAASLTGNAVVLVTVGAVLAAAQKALCDATRLGPPGNVVLTFVSSAALFVPQTLGQVPGHLGLAAAAGVWAWLVGMAPALIRPHGPERRATAHALDTAAAYAATGGTGDGHTGARAAAYAAVQSAWQSLLSAGNRPSGARRALERFVVRAEVALAAPADADPARLRAWARALRGTGAVPRTDDPRAGAAELLGVAAERVTGQRTPRAGLTPLAVRTALGCALAGYASLALGIGRPYWALVTAAALYQANLSLTWGRTVQRVVGNLAGVLLFAAVAPVAHLGPLALVLCCLAFSFGAEALISRNYWLGSVCVTPLALLVTEFAGPQRTGDLVTERAVDTLVGAVVGFVAALAVTDRRAGDRVERCLTAVDRAREGAARVLADPQAAPTALETARRDLATALVDLRTTADAAAGEWWQRALPQERVVLAERSGHRTLAATVRRQGLLPDPGTGTDTEDVRP
ncbi:FUSC family protein [Streptomyces griseoloalbus]|uniref:Putative membrane protein YccC n=1 Tax=Streptomyces griseoloalbus TaxID=67303 RepID=A0A7W8F7V6_9ACTN|nr:FUSC family protein [Streptomyces albaduncus]MBB5125342.1 putative membrane protein YccC [Streptomyces albaduncus]GGW28354.1 FUSC family protein [Streptomyces albaduncus]